MIRKRTSFRDFDKALFVAPLLIFLIGMVSLYSASYRSGQSLDQILAYRQLFWMLISMLAVFLVVKIDYFRIQDYVWPFYFLTLFLLVAVFFLPSRMGAHRWISLGGGFNIQPSELAKLAVILALGHFFTTNRFEYISRFKLMIPFVIVGVPFMLILKEPDLGTGLTLLPVFFAMLYLWGVPRKVILGFIGCIAALSPIAFHFLRDYQKSRLMVFINPNSDPLGAGYNIIQSKIAIGSGGWLGKGFMGGTQNQLNFIPERHTDFIFAVIGEESGFMGSLLTVFLFWFIVYKGFQIASHTPDRFGRQIACAITTLFAFQAFVNLGMTMGLLPVVGMPLPLVSYGGSSVLVTMLSIGILMNIKMHRPFF